jgi:hypothetical protein
VFFVKRSQETLRVKVSNYSIMINFQINKDKNRGNRQEAKTLIGQN